MDRTPPAPVEMLCPAAGRESAWSLAALRGRLVEVSAEAASAALTLALRLVLAAQREGEPAAWIAAEPGGLFFPPDAAQGGIDLEALAVVRLADPRQAPRAAEVLLRSGGFGLAVADLGAGAGLPLAAQSRLAGLVRRHQCVLLFLTRKGPAAPSLGSMVSLRAQAARGRAGEGDFRCRLRILKDKRGAGGAVHEEACRAPAGLR